MNYPKLRIAGLCNCPKVHVCTRLRNVKSNFNAMLSLPAKYGLFAPNTRFKGPQVRRIYFQSVLAPFFGSPTLQTTMFGLLLLGASSVVSVQSQTTASSGIERQEIRAQFKAIQQATLAAEFGARVKRLPVKEGGRFAQGDILVELDCSVQEAQQTKAQAELNGAQHTLRANRQMRKLQSVGALDVLLAESARDRAAGELAIISAQLDKCTIKAPFAGVVSERQVQQHEYVQTGQAVMHVFDDSLFEVEFLAPSTWISWVKPGLAFDLKIDELGIALPASVSQVGTRIDPVSQSVKVTGRINDSAHDLKPGMSGQAIFERK